MGLGEIVRAAVESLPILTMYGNLARGYSITLADELSMNSGNGVKRCFLYGFLIAMGIWLMGSLSGCAETRSLLAQRRYGPSTPGGYYVRLDPAMLHLAHYLSASLTVTVEDAAGKPADDVLVRFTHAQGEVKTASDLTQNGKVVATYLPPPGSDAFHSDFVIVSVEDVKVPVFIDIVPAVYGR